MARQHKNLKISIVPLSFFDLLFCTFGAFFFLMIMHVITTLNLIDIDYKNLIDNTNQENKELRQNLQLYKDVDKKFKHLQQQYDKLNEERIKIIRENKDLLASNSKHDKSIRLMQEKLDAYEKYPDKYKGKDVYFKTLEDRIHSLEGQNHRIEKEKIALQGIIQRLKSDIASLRSVKK